MDFKNILPLKKQGYFRISLVFVLIFHLIFIEGCSANTLENLSSLASNNSQSLNTSQSKKEKLAPFKYQTDNRYQSDLLKDVVSNEAIKTAYDVIDAFLEHKTYIKVGEKENYEFFAEEVGFTLNCIYPPFAAAAEYNSIKAYNEKDKTISWKYKFDKSKCDEIISKCEKATDEYMSDLREHDTDRAKALLLYNALTKNASYDYDVLNIDAEKNYEIFDKRTTAYNALVNKSGICYSYSFALVYLYMRAGINCITVSSQEGEGAHMWVMVKLDGKYYYVDPSWDVGGGFYRFGMTSADRASWAGSYAEDTCFAFTTPIKGNYLLNDESFFDMRSNLISGDSCLVTIDREKNQAVIKSELVNYILK